MNDELNWGLFKDFFDKLEGDLFVDVEDSEESSEEPTEEVEEKSETIYGVTHLG